MKDLGIDGKMILKRILNSVGGRGVWTKFTWLRIGTRGRHLTYANKHLGSVNVDNFLTVLTFFSRWSPIHGVG